MVARVEAIRLERSAVKQGAFDNAGADVAYREAFRQYGLDVEALAPDEAAERVRAAAIRDRLVAALDDWALCRPLTDRAGLERLLAVARRADDPPDEWRNRCREAFPRRDRAALEGLAADKDILGQAPA